MVLYAGTNDNRRENVGINLEGVRSRVGLIVAIGDTHAI